MNCFHVAYYLFVHWSPHYIKTLKFNVVVKDYFFFFLFQDAVILLSMLFASCLSVRIAGDDTTIYLQSGWCLCMIV